MPERAVWNERNLVDGYKIMNHVPTGMNFRVKCRIVRYCVLSWRAWRRWRFSSCRLWPWGFQEVEAPRFQDNRHMQVVRLSAIRTGRLYPKKYSWHSFLLEAEASPGTIVKPQLKNYIDTIGNRTRQLPVHSAVPQSAAPPHFVTSVAHWSWRGHWRWVLKGRKYTWLSNSCSGRQMVLVLKRPRHWLR